MLASTVFEQHQDELEELLQNNNTGCTKDNLQSEVFNHLSRLFQELNATQGNLTTSEATILNSVKALLESYNALIFHTQQYLNKRESNTSLKQDENGARNNNTAAKNIFASGLGAFFGKLIGGGWGAVAGSIAGSAVSQMNNKPVREERGSIKQEQTTNVDIEQTIKMTAHICTKLDELIETYRIQTKNIIERHTNQETPSLGKDYRILLEGLQSLLGFNRLHSSEKNYTSKLCAKVNNLEMLLDNYDIRIANYHDETQTWFNIIPSREVPEPVQVLPAVVENNQVILKGKVYVPNYE